MEGTVSRGDEIAALARTLCLFFNQPVTDWPTSRRVPCLILVYSEYCDSAGTYATEAVTPCALLAGVHAGQAYVAMASTSCSLSPTQAP